MTDLGWITTCGRICYRTRKNNVSQMFAGQKVGVKQVGEHIWLVTFMHYDLGYFNDENLLTRTDQESVRSESVTYVSGMKCEAFYPCLRNRPSKSGRGDWIRTSDPLRPRARSRDFSRCHAKGRSVSSPLIPTI